MSGSVTASPEARACAASFDPNALATGFYENPYPTYAALREVDPIHRCPDGTAVNGQQRAAGDAAVRGFTDYLRSLVADRRRNLRDDDLLSRLLQDPDLSVTELLHNCIFLLNAGHETTTNLIGNSLRLLLTHPDALQRLRATPQLIVSAVEECLRYETPNQLGNRLVVRPLCIRGINLEPDTYLTLCIGAANRDPEEFPQADAFDISRKPNRHLAFAAGGHACAGMSVAG